MTLHTYTPIKVPKIINFLHLTVSEIKPKKKKPTHLIIFLTVKNSRNSLRKTSKTGSTLYAHKKVAEQHILVKWCKSRQYLVISRYGPRSELE